MALVIRDTETLPPEDWTYYVQPTNHMVRTKSYVRLYPEVKLHCLSNGVNPPSEQEVIDYNCHNAHVPCFDSESASLIPNAWTLNLAIPPRLGGCCG
jgi:hypothetical protein